jgi:hypothetical protein
MLVFIGSGLVIGSVLGARFSVLALIPASALVLCSGAVAQAGQSGTPLWTALHMAALIASLQIGYLCAAGLCLSLRALWMMPESNTNKRNAVHNR